MQTRANWSSETLHSKWLEYANNRNNIELRNEIVEYYLNSEWVKTIIKKFEKNDYMASKYEYTNWTEVDYKSIIQTKLIKCVEQYDPTYIVKYVSDEENEKNNYKSKHDHKVTFEQYVNRKLRLAMQKVLRNLDPLSRYSRDAFKSLKEARKLAGEDANVDDIISKIVIPKYVYVSNPNITQARYYKTGLTAEQKLRNQYKKL